MLDRAISVRVLAMVVYVYGDRNVIKISHANQPRLVPTILLKASIMSTCATDLQAAHGAHTQQKTWGHCGRWNAGTVARMDDKQKEVTLC